MNNDEVLKRIVKLCVEQKELPWLMCEKNSAFRAVAVKQVSMFNNAGKTDGLTMWCQGFEAALTYIAKYIESCKGASLTDYDKLAQDEGVKVANIIGGRPAPYNGPDDNIDDYESSDYEDDREEDSDFDDDDDSEYF